MSGVGGFAALTLLAAGPVMAVGSGTAAAQNTVMTQDYTIGTGPVSNVTAVAQPGTAGVMADYTVGFTTPSALAAGTGTITISDASGSTVFPEQRRAPTWSSTTPLRRVYSRLRGPRWATTATL